MRTPVIKIIATGELLNPDQCFIFTCGTLSYTTLDIYGHWDKEIIYTSKEWEWSQQTLDILGDQSYEEHIEECRIQEEIDKLMEDLSFKDYKEYDAHRKELEIQFKLKPK